MQRVHFIVIVLFLVTPSKGIADMFAGYDAFCGLPVVVGPNPQMATAETDRIGRKFIHIDPRAMSIGPIRGFLCLPMNVHITD